MAKMASSKKGKRVDEKPDARWQWQIIQRN